jgi:hypothetical protein
MLDGELSPSRIPKTQLICSYSATASVRRGDCLTDDVYSTKGTSRRYTHHKQKATKLLYIEDTNQQVELEIGGSTRINRESKEGKAMMDELSQQLVGQDQVESLE